MSANRIHQIVLVLFTAVLVAASLLSCDPGAVSSSRDHPHDPGNPDYLPQRPGSISAVFIPDEDGHVDGRVLVRWGTSSHFEDGFLIERSHGDTDTFGKVGNVGNRVVEWIDQRGNHRPGTRYRVTSYVMRDGEQRRHLTEPVALSFGQIVFPSSPAFFRTPSEFRFTIEKRRVYRDGITVELVRPQGGTETLLDTREDIPAISVDNDRYTRHRFTLPYEDSVAPGSRIRVSWYVLVSGRLYVAGQSEHLVMIY